MRVVAEKVLPAVGNLRRYGAELGFLEPVAQQEGANLRIVGLENGVQLIEAGRGNAVAQRPQHEIDLHLAVGQSFHADDAVRLLPNGDGLLYLDAAEKQAKGKKRT